MENDATYYKDPPQLILNLMKDTFGNRFNHYYLGGPTVNFADAAYPVCIVQSIQSSNTIKGAPTGTDSIGELIHIHFLEQSKDNANSSDEVDTTMRTLYQKIQGRDPANGFYLAGTALFALRSNLTLKSGDTGFQTTIDHDINVDYNIIPRRDRDTIVEAQIAVVTRERVIVPNRQ